MTSSIGKNRPDRRHTLTRIRALFANNIRERWPDAQVVFNATSPDCDAAAHDWKRWRSVRDYGRAIHIDSCERRRSVRVKNGHRQRSESARSVYVRRTLFYATTRQRGANRSRGAAGGSGSRTLERTRR